MIRLDRYILRQFIQSFLFALLAFIMIFLTVDMMENLDDFLDRNASADIILRYYFYFLPEIIQLMVPVAMLLSALFTTARLSTFNELAAMKSGGMSLYRLMAPLLIFALLISAASIYFNGWVVPFANKKKFEIARVYFQKNIEYVSKINIFIQDSPTRILSITSYDDERNVGRGVSIQDFDPSDPTVMTGRYDASLMIWNETSQSWSLSKGMERTFTPAGEKVRSFEGLFIGKLHFTPEEIRKKQLRPEEMDYNDLHDFIEAQERAGQDVARWLVDFYGKIAFPFASFIVVLFGVPFSSIKRRSGLGVEVGIAIAICFAYMIFLKVSQAFGYNGDLNPLLTAWLANILFLAGGISLLLKVPK